MLLTKIKRINEKRKKCFVCRKHYIIKHDKNFCSGKCKSLYYRKHRRYKKELRLKTKKPIKEIIFSHYGTKCKFCGENNLKLLVLHHLDFDGDQERKELGIVPGVYFYWYLYNNDLFNRKDLQVLCTNCHGGIHQKHRKNSSS